MSDEERERNILDQLNEGDYRFWNDDDFVFPHSDGPGEQA
jgi:hypothetical protein